MKQSRNDDAAQVVAAVISMHDSSFRGEIQLLASLIQQSRIASSMCMID